jgi:large subunit ribosomal protein L19
MNAVDLLEKERMKKDAPKFQVGDLVDVHVKITEGEKERVQIFNGMVIAKKGRGYRETFTVRRIVQGEGVERVFPVHSPNLVDIEVKKSHKVRRAKLYYLRDRSGKSARLKEKFTEKKKKKKTKAKKATKPAAQKVEKATVPAAETTAKGPTAKTAAKEQPEA